jgi:hypothetical protein
MIKADTKVDSHGIDKLKENKIWMWKQQKKSKEKRNTR